MLEQSAVTVPLPASMPLTLPATHTRGTNGGRCRAVVSMIEPGGGTDVSESIGDVGTGEGCGDKRGFFDGNVGSLVGRTGSGGSETRTRGDCELEEPEPPFDPLLLPAPPPHVVPAAPPVLCAAE